MNGPLLSNAKDDNIDGARVRLTYLLNIFRTFIAIKSCTILPFIRTFGASMKARKTTHFQLLIIHTTESKPPPPLNHRIPNLHRCNRDMR